MSLILSLSSCAVSSSTARTTASLGLSDKVVVATITAQENAAINAIGAGYLLASAEIGGYGSFMTKNVVAAFGLPGINIAASIDSQNPILIREDDEEEIELIAPIAVNQELRSRRRKCDCNKILPDDRHVRDSEVIIKGGTKPIPLLKVKKINS